MTGRLLGSIARSILGAAFLLGAATASAQPLSDRPLRVVVGFAPGGSADIMARLIGQKLTASLGQPVVVENRPGAGGTIAAAAVAGAAADGTTLLLVTSGHAGSAAVYPKLPYDPLASFAPVAKLGAAPVVIVAPAASALRSLDDVLAAPAGHRAS